MIVSCELLVVETVTVSVPDTAVVEFKKLLERVAVAVVCPFAVVVKVEVPDLYVSVSIQEEVAEAVNEPIVFETLVESLGMNVVVVVVPRFEAV